MKFFQREIFTGFAVFIVLSSAGQSQSTNNASLKQLIIDADIAMKMKTISVTDNNAIPPSKNKNDFYSWAPYLWPNPATPTGYPYINKDGQTNPETEARSDKPLLRRMAVAAETLALAWRETHDKKYANRSAEFIRTWFLNAATKMNPNMDFGQCAPGVEKGTATGIIDSRWFVLLIDAVDYLKGSDALTAREEIALQKWFADYLNWLTTSKIGIEEGKRDNNHGSWYAAQTAYFAMFTGNKTLAKKIVSESKSYFDKGIDSLGRQVHELGRTKSYDYSLYNLFALITLAKIGDKVGVDLWHYNLSEGNKHNIKSSIEYMAAFEDENVKWPFQQIAPKVISLNYGDGDHFSVYYPYDLYSALRVGYKIYRDEKFLQQLNKLNAGKAATNRSNILITW